MTSLEQAMTWQSIETAPKDGRFVQLFVPALMRSQAGAIKQAEVLPEKLLKVLNAEADKLLEKETTEK